MSKKLDNTSRAGEPHRWHLNLVRLTARLSTGLYRYEPGIGTMDGGFCQGHLLSIMSCDVDENIWNRVRHKLKSWKELDGSI